MNHKRRFVPSLFTSLNIFFGFLSIVSSVKGELDIAAWYIIFAVICDGMDGRLARWTHSETPFGFELDSLGDLISGGIAPAIMIYQGNLIHLKYWGILACFVYLFSGSFRLARFNVIQIEERIRGFVGLPLPITGFTLASLWIFKPVSLTAFLWITSLIFLSLLMMSTIHYDWPKITFRSNKWKSLTSFGVLLSVVIMSFFPYWCLFPFLCLYIFLGISNWIVALIQRKTKLSGLFVIIHK
jgi:CDP-diacylglycerol--serine O-phosphatidyltransferase